VLLFQDIAAIPLLAIVPLLARERAGSGAGRRLARAARAVRRGRGGRDRALSDAAHPARRGQDRQREVFSAFTLLLGLGIAR
jgi:glutathione-regulated potassium-efflux system ancillary protein KefC